MPNYIKQINTGGVAYDIKAAADASGNIITDTYLKINPRFSTAKGTNPSSNTYLSWCTLENSGSATKNRLALVESAWVTDGTSRLNLYAYSSASNSTNYIGLVCYYPSSGNPYVYVSGQDVDSAAVRNISYGTDAPSGGSNGQIYIRYL